MGNSKKLNNSLKAFSRAITVSTAVGIGTSLLGLALLAFSLAGTGILTLTWGVLFLYIGSGLIGLAIAGLFLRQTARVIVEGMGGNIFEGETAEERNSENAAHSILKSAEYSEWIDAGQPDLSTWNSDQPFNEWLEKQK